MAESALMESDTEIEQQVEILNHIVGMYRKRRAALSPTTEEPRKD